MEKSDFLTILPSILMFSFFLILGLLALSVVVYSLYYGISPMPSSRNARRFIIGMIPETVEGMIFELGSGWGSLALDLARHFPNRQIRAYEISPIPWGYSQLAKSVKAYSNIKILREDFFKVDLREASVVICYLYPGAMSKLKEKFEKELKTGAWVITNTFAVPGWRPAHVYSLSDLYRTPIYLYQIIDEIK